MTPLGPTLGVYIGLPVTILFLLIGVALLAGGWYCAATDRNDNGGAYVFMGTGVVGMLVTALVAGFVWWPWAPSFHTVYRVHGQVSSVGSRQISDGTSMSTRYVFMIDGHQYGVDDTRAALTKPGDTVTLTCTKQYVWRAEAGWACNWGDSSQ